jgi:hypothetical protein
MGERDRVVFVQSSMPFSVVRTNTGAQKLEFTVATIESVLWLDGAGVGVIWDGPVDAMVALAGQKVQRGWAQFGFYEQGDVVLTLQSDSPAYDMGERDRVVFVQSSMPFSVVRTNTGAQKLEFPVATIESVLWLDGAGVRVDGALPAVAADGTLTWASGAPPADTQYSITGRKRPEYFCWGDFPQDRAHHGGLPLPRRVVLRRFDLFGRTQP